MAAIAPLPELDSLDLIHTGPITLEQYLETSYRPDCDFVDGYLEERTLGGAKHGLLQMQLGFWFISHQQEWKIRVLSELRTQTTATRIRLPDVCVVHEDTALQEELRVTPPFIAIEILSPADRISRVMLRMQEFLAMGVPHVWLLDPVERVAFILTTNGLRLVEAPRLTIPNSPIYLDLPGLFSALD